MNSKKYLKDGQRSSKSSESLKKLLRKKIYELEGLKDFRHPELYIEHILESYTEWKNSILEGKPNDLELLELLEELDVLIQEMKQKSKFFS